MQDRMGQLIALNSKCKRIFYVGFFYLFLNNFCYSQETHPARVLTGPTFASELFELQIPQIKELVPNLVNIELGFDLANWYWSCNPSVAAATMSIHVDIGEVKYVGFVMKLPSGGEKRVSFEEIGIQANRNPSICDIRLDIDFSKFNIHASTEIDVNKSGKGQGSIRFSNELPQEFHDYLKFDHEKKRYKTVQEIFSGLDPKVRIVHRGSYNCNIMNFESNFYLNQIKKYIDNEYKENDLNNKIKTLLTEAQNAESSGRIDEAIMKYEEAYKLKKVPEIKLKIDDLKTKKTSLESTENNPNVNNPTSINDNGTNNSFNSNSANPEDLRKFNEMQQNVNDWNQNWYNNIQREEMLRKQKQEMYDREVQKFANNLVDIINKIEQEKQQREINSAYRKVDLAVSRAFEQLHQETDYWQKYLKSLLNISRKYAGYLNKQAYDEIENTLNTLKKTLDDIEENHKQMQQRLQKDWEYANHDPRRFPIKKWTQFSYGKDPYINLSKTFEIGSKIGDNSVRCAFISEILPLINNHAKLSQTYNQLLYIEVNYSASGCLNREYENLLKSAKAIESFKNFRNQKEDQILEFKKKTEEEYIEIKINEKNYTGVKAKIISNTFKIEPIDLEDLYAEYDRLYNHAGEFEAIYKSLNPDNVIRIYKGDKKAGQNFQQPGTYVLPGDIVIMLSRDLSTPSSYLDTLFVQKGQKFININPNDYRNVFELFPRFKPYDIVFDNHSQKFNSFGKTRWLSPQINTYNSGITAINLTTISLIESYNPIGFGRGRPVFIHNLDFFTITFGGGKLITGASSPENNAHYKLYSNLIYYGIDVLRYEPGFTISTFKGNGEVTVSAGGVFSTQKFINSEKEEVRLGDIKTNRNHKTDNWYLKGAVYPNIKYTQRIGKNIIQFGYSYNSILSFDPIKSLKYDRLETLLYKKYTPMNNLSQHFKQEFSIRLAF